MHFDEMGGGGEENRRSGSFGGGDSKGRGVEVRGYWVIDKIKVLGDMEYGIKGGVCKFWVEVCGEVEGGGAYSVVVKYRLR